MILYLDTSALVKLYADEQHSPTVREAVADARMATTHRITYAEIRAAFARKVSGKRAVQQLARWRRELDADWANLHVVEVTEMLIQRAGDLAERYRLRGYDSVHLAAAEQVAAVAQSGATFAFAVFDTELRDAARKHGLPLLNPG